MNLRDLKQLQALYARVPKLPCKGLCHTSCGPIALTPVEARILAGRVSFPLTQLLGKGADLPWAHFRPPPGESVLMCPREGEDCQLLVEGRCSQYLHRPMICRLWGVVETMPCPFGCVPEAGYLTEDEGFALLDAVSRLSQRVLGH